MSENKNIQPKKVYLDSRFYYCLVIALFVFIALFYALTNKNYFFNDNTSKKFDSKWFMDDGTEVNFDVPVHEESYTIHKNIQTENLINKSLCFYSKNVYFSIFVDGMCIYDFHPTPIRLFGKSYGIFPHAVNIPNLYQNSEITIKIDNLYEETPGYIKSITLGNGNYFILNEMQKNAPEFILCTIVFVLGAVSFVIGIAGKYFGDRRYEIISMGTLAMVAAIWIASESSFFALLVSAPIAIHFIDYTTLALLPLPTVLFSSFVTDNKESKSAMFVGVLSALNLLTQILLNSFQIRDYHQLLIISHIILAITVIIVVYLFIKSIVLKKISKGVVIVLTLTFLVPLFIGAEELIRYRISPRNYKGTIAYQYILFLFIFLCSIYEFISIAEMSRKGQYAEIMEKIAYTDGLTGINNREAYNKFLDSKLNNGDVYTLVMLDMNNLKDVNDQYGHATGDEYIKSLAKFIREAFEGNGDCYRMGGDEFLVISNISNVDIKFLECLDSLYSKIEEYNKDKNAEIPLSVAVGYSGFAVGVQSLKEALREADSKMYERKKKMKENDTVKGEKNEKTV